MTSWCQKSKIRLADSEEDWIVLDRAYRVGLQHVTQQLSRYSKTWRKRHELMVMVIPRLPGLCDGQIPCGFGGSPGSQMVHFGGGDREEHSAGGGMKRNLEVVYLTYRNCSWKLQQWNISFFFLLKLCIVFCCTFNFPHLLYHLSILVYIKNYPRVSTWDDDPVSLSPAVHLRDRWHMRNHTMSDPK